MIEAAQWKTISTLFVSKSFDSLEIPSSGNDKLPSIGLTLYECCLMPSLNVNGTVDRSCSNLSSGDTDFFGRIKTKILAISGHAKSNLKRRT